MQRCREAEWRRGREAERQRGRESERQTDTEAETETGTWTGTETETDTETDRDRVIDSMMSFAIVSKLMLKLSCGWGSGDPRLPELKRELTLSMGLLTVL